MKIIRKPAGIRSAITAVVIVLLAVTGCGQSAALRLEAERESERGAGGAAAQERLPGGIVATNWHIPWRTTDPKNPHSRPVTVLIADANAGKMTSQDNNFALNLSGVRAQLFSEGRHAADLQAAQVKTDRRSQIVNATGGVRLISLTSPPDSVLTADRLTWDTHTKVLVATGNAHFVRQQPGKPILDDYEPSIKYNIATGDIAD